jgi:hypothetical protein
MVKPLGAARVVAAPGLYKVAYAGPAPCTHHRNLHRQSQRKRHEKAVLAEEDQERPRGVVEPAHAPEQQAYFKYRIVNFV